VGSFALRRWLAVALLAGLLVPGAIAGFQLVQVADAQGCPARLVPHTGGVAVRVYVENSAQALALDPQALSRYLSDRAGRAVQVLAVEQADATGFRLAAAARPVTGEVLAFLAYQPNFPHVPTAHGMVDALGFATPGSACAYVSFLPSQPTLCRLSDAVEPLQPGYAYLAHEMGHLMGLAHAAVGVMGKGVFELCHGDQFTPQQRAALQAWGSR
jgi:hypothetical protein